MYNTVLFNQIIFNGLPDLEIESPTQELAISQQTPIQNYDYSLAVASQTLLIDQPISIIVAISKTLYPDAIGLTLSQSIPTINYDYSFSCRIFTNSKYITITLSFSFRTYIIAERPNTYL